MPAVPHPTGDRTERSITIWAAISTVLLAALISAGYLLALGLGGSSPVDKAGGFGFGVGLLALSVAILPGLAGTLIAFFVAGRVESLGLSPSDKIAAEVERRLMNSVVIPQYANGMKIARTDLVTLSEPDVSRYLRGAHTLKMMFLYERFWGDVYGRLLRDWLEKDEAARIFIYLPQTTTALMTSLSARHGTDVPGFTGRVRDVRRKLDEALGSGSGRQDLRDRVHYGIVPAPGPSYSGYLFDSRKYDSRGDRLAGDQDAPTKVRVIARMYATSDMGSYSELPTLFAEDGTFAEFIRRDIDAVHDRQAGSFT